MISKKAFKALKDKQYLAAAIPLIVTTPSQGIECYSGGTGDHQHIATSCLAF